MPTCSPPQCPPVFSGSGGHALLVHAAAEGLDVVADVRDHAVPLVPLRRLLALVRGHAPSCRAVPVGGGVGGGACCAAVASEAVRDDASAVLHTDGLQEILKVLAVLLWYEGAQACSERLQGIRLLFNNIKKVSDF